MLWGIALATRALGPNPKAPWLLDLHRHLGGLTVLFTGIHMGALVADTYVHFGLADLLVPFASPWKTGRGGLGCHRLLAAAGHRADVAVHEAHPQGAGGVASTSPPTPSP